MFAFVSLDKQSTSLTIVLKHGAENFDFAVNILRGGGRRRRGGGRRRRGRISFNELTRDGFYFITGHFERE